MEATVEAEVEAAMEVTVVEEEEAEVMVATVEEDAEDMAVAMVVDADTEATVDEEVTVEVDDVGWFVDRNDIWKLR